MFEVPSSTATVHPIGGSFTGALLAKALTLNYIQPCSKLRRSSLNGFATMQQLLLLYLYKYLYISQFVIRELLSQSQTN